MSISTLYNFSIDTPAQITDELYTDAGASTFQLGTIKRAFKGLTDIVVRTAAGGGGTLLIEDTDYTIENEDFDLTASCGYHVYTGIKIINVTYQTGDLYLTYKVVGSYTDVASIVAIMNASLAMPRVGKIFQTMEEITLSDVLPWWNIANPSQSLDVANFVDYVPFLRAVQAKTKWTSAVLTGTVTLAGTAITGSGSNFDPELTVGDLVFIEKLNQFRYIETRTSDTAATVSEPGTAAAGARIWKITRQSAPASFNADFPITAYQITAATAFSLWLNEASTTKQPENYSLMKAIAEAYACDREYGTITLATAIGGIPEGTYQITSVTLANVGTTSAVIVCSASGLTAGAKTADTSNITIYPHRVAGSTTTARHYEITDAAIMNDGIYNVLGMRTRDFRQGSTLGYGIYPIQSDLSLAGGAATNARCAGSGNDLIIMSDGINETPRIGPQTNPRAGIFNMYIYVGEYVA